MYIVFQQTNQIVWGENRNDAIERSKRALDEFAITGVHTTVPFHLKVLENPKFIEGNFDTGFIGKELT